MIPMSDDPTATQSPPPWGAPPPAGHGGRRLHRSTTDRYLGGVAGGIAQTYDVDPIIVRVVFVVLVALGGSGVIIYLALWLLVPADDGSLPVVREPRRDRGLLIGIILLGIGVIVLMNHLARHGPFVFDLFWPVVLIAGGLAVLLARADNGPSAPATTAPSTMPGEVPPASTATATDSETSPTVTDAGPAVAAPPAPPPPVLHR
jgi:phage shock protein PspC (stress-responsive transcriptional regulator)